MASGGCRTVFGSRNGTGAALDITTVGFRPKYVKVTNVAAGGLCMYEWQETMPDASATKVVTAGTRTYITTLGITPLANGFTLGADTDLNVAGETLHFEARD